MVRRTSGVHTCLRCALNRLQQVRFDMRAHGRSGKPERPEDYESIRYAEDVQAVIDGFKLNKPILAGWSVRNGLSPCFH
jgi:pimeloyl-ACP methyl ester carboxylesterase